MRPSFPPSSFTSFPAPFSPFLLPSFSSLLPSFLLLSFFPSLTSFLSFLLFFLYKLHMHGTPRSSRYPFTPTVFLSGNPFSSFSVTLNTSQEYIVSIFNHCICVHICVYIYCYIRIDEFILSVLVGSFSSHINVSWSFMHLLVESRSQQIMAPSLGQIWPAPCFYK